MTGIVVCGGSVDDYSSLRKHFDGADLIICADSGAAHLEKFGIVPDILVGDFDSISEPDYNALSDKGIEIIKYPVEKDATDTQLAVQLAVERGCDSIILLGATGTRLDHTMANIFLLRMLLESGIKGIIADGHNEIAMIDSTFCFKREKDVRVSLVPAGGRVTGVTTEGLYYPLVDAVLEFGTTQGVSNEFTGDTASVTVKSGLLLVIKSKD